MPHWTVRAALASVLGTLTPEAGLPRLRAMLNDPDARVVPPVLDALAKLHPPDAAQIMLDRLASTDPFIRAAAADALAQLKPPSGVAALADAYRRGEARRYLRRAGGGAGRGGGIRSRSGDAAAHERARRQGLGGACPRGAAAETVRSGDRRRWCASARRRRASRAL